MRLIHTRTKELVDFISTSGIVYAILSHTWEDEEVTYQEMISPTESTFCKRGYIKIACACQQALIDNYEYIWVDTCCIDKSSSAELSETINSMFQYYADADICYVLLSDLQPDDTTPEQLGKCRWFRRGWTLQELLAPKQLTFYDGGWNFRGVKQQFIHHISLRTGIPEAVLVGTKQVQDYSVAVRMSWAASRETTRTEDLAYCLLGIFDVNMPMLYGEGAKAFRRLQEEIIKQNNDLTIFAWRHAFTSEVHAKSLFAPNSTAFIDVGPISPYPNKYFDFSITNKGLHIADEVELKVLSSTTWSLLPSRSYALPLGFYFGTEVGIYLRKIGPRLFRRDKTNVLFTRDKVASDFRRVIVTNFYIANNPTLDANLALVNCRRNSIHIPTDDVWHLTSAAPENLWDEHDRVFLRSRPSRNADNDLVLGAKFLARIAGSVVWLIVLCRMHGRLPQTKVYQHHPEAYSSQQQDAIFHHKYEEDGMYWIELESTVPDSRTLSHKTKVIAGSSAHEVTVTLALTNFSADFGECLLYQLNLTTKAVNIMNQNQA